ncbi:hypothetical protein CK203_116699 [Vitis vinifera]|uniref:Uncharacterized protein n=1 Tax=Vitis vinifera TaxID=29760 RepID=A0A438C4S2_VITVI|nr:hypothetical protein CK203_116699 [Vitis vinifera]
MREGGWARKRREVLFRRQRELCFGCWKLEKRKEARGVYSVEGYRERLINDLRSVVNSHVGDNELRILVDSNMAPAMHGAMMSISFE